LPAADLNLHPLFIPEPFEQVDQPIAARPGWCRIHMRAGHIQARFGGDFNLYACRACWSTCLEGLRNPNDGYKIEIKTSGV
jgi:hypothetical protein